MKAEELEKVIAEAIPNAKVMAADLTGTGDHFEAVVVSKSFAGKSRVQCHQMVMDSVKELLKGPLHALTIKTKIED